MQVELRRIHSELNVSTLLVTHSQEEALVMSDRIAVMRRGRIECIDTPYVVYNRPPNSFVCTFVGDANIFECDVGCRSGTARPCCAAEALQFVGRRAGGLSKGQKLTVAIRPENVALHRARRTSGWHRWRSSSTRSSRAATSPM